MNHRSLFLLSRGRGLLGAGLSALLLAGAPILAAPGAHGPNGEHLDAPAQAVGAGGATPRIEARSEDFELVGRLQGGELSIMINRFATNEPVLNATVEVESGGLKAAARFHADMGDYAVDDATLLKALAVPGEHALVIMVLTGADSDLLDGTLKVQRATDDHGHAHENGDGHGIPRTAWLALVPTLVVLAIAGWYFRRKRRINGVPMTGGMQ